MPESVLVALITGILGLIGVIWQSRKTRRINSQEHGVTATKMDRIEAKVDRIDLRTDKVREQLEDHLDYHRELNDN